MVESDGHAFICYVREDRAYADRVQGLLQAANIPFWRDTENLWPGQDWRQRIREAITNGAFAFIPIFSTTSVAKGVSGQNEELYLAAEEMRRRQPGVPWIFPVRFNECELPKLRLAGGDTLDSIQRADLFGPDGDRQGERLVEGIRQIIQLGQQQPQSTPVQPADPADGDSPLIGSSLPVAHRPRIEREVVDLLRDAGGDIRLFDAVMPLADAVHDEFADTSRFPLDGRPDFRAGAAQVESYWRGLDGLLDLLVIAGAWSLETHARIWSEAVERVASARGEGQSGNTARLRLRWFPNLPMLYAGGLAATRRGNYAMVRAFALDVKIRDEGHRMALVARSHPWRPFSEFPVLAQVLALEASGEIVDDSTVESLLKRTRGSRHTPVSDLLHDRLRPKFRTLLPDDNDYSDLFDEFEVLLGLLVADLKNQLGQVNGEVGRGPWIDEPATGRFTWRGRHAERRTEQRMQEELLEMQESWPPLRGGLFGGSATRAQAAFGAYIDIAANARRHQW